MFTILGDGEIQEGQVWEAAMFATAKGLDNLVAVVDNNNLQIDGTVEDVNSPYPIPEKFAAFGWHVIEIDAHDFDQIEAAFAEARANPPSSCKSRSRARACPLWKISAAGTAAPPTPSSMRSRWRSLTPR